MFGYCSFNFFYDFVRGVLFYYLDKELRFRGRIVRGGRVSYFDDVFSLGVSEFELVIIEFYCFLYTVL